MEDVSVEGRILTALFALVRATAAEIRRAGATTQLTVPQFFTLRLLAASELTVTELARSLHVSMPTVTQSADSLVAKGLVERYTDDRDRRQVKMRITAQGLALMEKCRRPVDAYFARLLSALPEERHRELAEALEAVNARVEEGSPARGA